MAEPARRELLVPVLASLLLHAVLLAVPLRSHAPASKMIALRVVVHHPRTAIARSAAGSRSVSPLPPRPAAPAAAPAQARPGLYRPAGWTPAAGSPGRASVGRGSPHVAGRRVLAPDAVEAATLFVDRGTNDGPALLASAEGRPSGADGPGGGGPGAVTGGVPGGVPGGVVGGSPPGVPGGTGDAPGLTPASFAPSRPSAGAGNGGGAERQPPRPVVRHKAEAAPVGPAAASPPAPAAAPAPHAAAPQPERDAPAPALARPSEPKDPPAAKPAPADDLPERPRPTARPRPDGLRSEKLTSRVPLRVHIAVSADGHITSVSVSSSCGDSAIDDRVCSFVRREWRFSRARQGGSFSQTFQVQPAEPR